MIAPQEQSVKRKTNNYLANQICKDVLIVDDNSFNIEAL